MRRQSRQTNRAGRPERRDFGAQSGRGSIHQRKNATCRRTMPRKQASEKMRSTASLKENGGPRCHPYSKSVLGTYVDVRAATMPNAPSV